MFDNIREDFSAHERDPWRQGVWALLVYRFGPDKVEQLARALQHLARALSELLLSEMRA